jgi:uncharacterized protein (TIGR03085 family)
MGTAKDERLALSALFEELGPEAPTLCEGWRTRDLAAHLIVREHRMDAAPGILIPALAGYTQRVQDGYGKRPWAELIAMVRKGPSRFWPTAIGPLDELANAAEFLVHHEDVRRAQPGWEPRPAEPERDAATWKAVAQTARLNYRNSPVGVVLRAPDGREVKAKSGPDTVTIVGEPMELLLHGFGRDAVKLSFEGTETGIAAHKSANRGM